MSNMAMKSILDGKTNPIGFDSDKEILTYDNSVDISEYSDFQKDVLGRYKELITNETDVNLKVVDINEAIEDAGGQSLKGLNAAGITIPYTYQDGAIAKLNVYVGRNPVKSNGSSEKKEYSGVTNIHEMGGHSFLYLTKSALKKNDHNKLVEDLHKKYSSTTKLMGLYGTKGLLFPFTKEKKNEANSYCHIRIGEFLSRKHKSSNDSGFFKILRERGTEKGSYDYPFKCKPL